jgi:hypothetical protein
MKFLSDILAKAGLTVDGVVTLNNTATGQTPDANDNSTKLATTAWVRTFVQPYSLPIASASTLGGIKVGTGLSIDSGSGVLSVTGGSASSLKSTQTFVVTEGQTVFTVTNGYAPGLIDIFLNGVYLSPNQSTATNGSTFTLNEAAATGDIIDVIVASPVYQGTSTTTDQLPEGVVNLYYTNARARAAVSLTTTGVSGAATYNSSTGVFNIPNYQGLVPSGGIAGDILAKVDGTDYNTTWIPNFTSTVQHTVKAGVDLTKGQAVYVSSADGTNMIVSKASNASEQTSSKTLGLVAQNLATNGQGFVVTEGLLAGLNTNGANAGDPVWLGTDGNLIFGLLNKPTAPAHLVFIGVVTRVQQNNGEIFVKVQNGFELDELHDLSVKNASDGDMIKYVASTGLWTKVAASTTNIVEGTNLYYTDARVGTYLTNNSYATQSYVNTAVSNLVDAAPGTLDTLNELAAALGDDPNFATTVATSIGTKQAQLNGTGFVKVSGTTVSYDNSTYYLASNPNGYITGISFANVSAKPTTIAGYGITDSLVYTTSTYSDPSWITALAWSKITGAPAFITGYTETDTLQSVILRNSTTNTGFTITNTNDTYSTAASTNVPVIYLYNTGTTATSNAIIAIRTSSATGGDPILSFDIGGVQGWSMGIDNSDSDKFKIARSWAALDSDTRFSMAVDGTANFTGSLTAANLSGTNTGDQTNISGNAVTVSQRDFSGDISTGGMGRFTGWYTGNAATGLAAEIGTSGGQVYIIAYNRQTSTYGTVNIEGSASTLRITGSTVNVVTGSLQQGGNQVWHAGNFIPSNYLPLSGGTVTGKTNIGTGGSTNGGIFNVTGGTDNQMNISHNSSWGLLLGYCNESSPTGYHGPNHAAIINVQDAPLHLGSNNSSVLRIVSTGASILGNTIIHAGNYNSYALPLSGGTMSGTPVFAAAWSNAGGDYTGITNPAYKVDVASGYWRVVYKGAHSSVSGVYNFESGKNVYWGEPTDTGDYVFRGRSIKWAASNGTEYTVWNSSNLTNLNQLTNGPGYITGYTETDTLATVMSRGSSTASGITFTAPGGSILLKHAVSEVDAWIFQENAANWGLYWKNNPSGNHTFGGYTTVGAELFGMSAANVNGNGVLTSNFVGATSAYAQWMMSNFTGYIWSASTIFAAGDMRAPRFYSSLSSGTMFSHGAMTDAFGYNGSYGTYIGSPVGGTYYIYANGTFFDNGTIRTLIHSGNIGSQSVNYATSAGSASVASRAYYSIDGFTNTGGHGTSYIQNELPAANNGAATGRVVLYQWCSEPGVTWDWAGFGYNVINNGGSPSGFGRFNGNFGQAYMRFSPSGDWFFYNTTTGGTRTSSMTLSSTGAASFGSTISNGSVWINNGGNFNAYNENIRLFNAPNGVSVIAFSASGESGMPTTSILGYSDRMEFRYGNGEQFRIWNGYVTVAGSLTAASSVTGNDVYTSGGWFRNHTNNNGIYWSNTGWHLYPENGSDFYVHSGNSDASIHFIGGGTTRNYIHNSAANEIGFLNTGRNWIFRVDNSGNATASGDVTAYSDKRIKSNITPVKNALEKVLQLTGVYYNRIDIEDKSTKLGFIAQDVKEIVPEVVSVQPDLLAGISDRHSIDYSKMVALLTEAIKEQQTQIESQKSEIEELKDLVKQLINR